MEIPRLPQALARRYSILFMGLLWAPWGLWSQVLMNGTGADGRVRLHSSDVAIFVAGDERRDLPCSVSPNKPVLGFDLRFHSTYEVAIPLSELAGSEDLLQILFRVFQDEAGSERVHFTQRIRVPEIEDGAKGDAYLHGSFDVGVGRYKVEWLMRDRAGRVCSSFWDVEAGLDGKDQDVELRIPPGRITPTEWEQFREEPPVLRISDPESLNVKVLVNFAPQNQHSATLRPIDTSALVSILRTISREPRITKFSVVAFNLHERRILYRQDNADQIDFPAIGDSLDTLSLGTVDIQRLSEQDGETSFLAGLIREELASDAPVDALIFAGPKAMLSRGIPEEEVRGLGSLRYPVYYMNYNLNPYEVPWRDTIGVAVKMLHGREFTITRPRDLFHAVTEMVSDIVKDKGSRHVTAASSE